MDVWDVRGSYATQGTALCFLSRAQELTPKPPEGYSAEAVDAILAPFAEDPLTGTDGAAAESRLARRDGRSGTQRRPPLAMQRRSSPKHSPTTGPTSSPS